MILADIISLFLRFFELIFSIIVLALTASWLHSNNGRTIASRKRFIYTEIIAALSILFALIFLIPFAGTFIHWPIDLLLFIANMVAFGLLISYIHRSCNSIWGLENLSRSGSCGRFRADVSFLFLASIFFAASALLGLHVLRKHRRNTVVDKQTGNGRKQWYRSRH